MASFIWQARARYPENLKQKMLESYMEALLEYTEIDRDEFDQRLRLFILSDCFRCSVHMDSVA